MPRMIVIEWENEVDTSYNESDKFASSIGKYLEPLGFSFLVRGYDDGGRYNSMTGYKESADA